MISTSRKMWYSYERTVPSARVFRRSSRRAHLVSDLDRHSTEPREDDTVSCLDGHGDDDTITVGSSGTDGEDEGLGRRSGGRGGGEVDARGGFLRTRRRLACGSGGVDGHAVVYLYCLDPLDDDTIEEGDE